jgi:hypothetical protein
LKECPASARAGSKYKPTKPRGSSFFRVELSILAS